jgi:hypothetical protein
MPLVDWNCLQVLTPSESLDDRKSPYLEHMMLSRTPVKMLKFPQVPIALRVEVGPVHETIATEQNVFHPLH